MTSLCHKVGATVFVFGLCLFQWGCETNEDNKMSQAQLCIDNAKDGNDAATCMGYVSGIQSAKASSIRCAALYIERGVTESKMIQAFNSVKQSGSTNDPVLTMMSYVTFSGTNSYNGNSTAITDASTLFTECSASGSSGMTMMAMATKVGTDVFDAFGGGSVTPANLDTAITDLYNSGTATSTETKTKVGQAAILAQSVYCKGSTSSDEVCKVLNDAITTGGGDALAVGNALASLLKD